MSACSLVLVTANQLIRLFSAEADKLGITLMKVDKQAPYMGFAKTTKRSSIYQHILLGSVDIAESIVLCAIALSHPVHVTS